MELFHTGSKIEEINNLGRFDEFLFFANSACHYGEVTYSIEVDEDEIIDPNGFFYRDDCDKLAGIVAQVMDLAECDEDEAEELLSQRESHDDPEIDWDIQTLTARAAKLLGFRGVEIQDEHGTSYMIDMLGRESELTEV